MQQLSPLASTWVRELWRERLMQYDWVLLGTIFTLLTLGIIMVFSASYFQGLLRVVPDGLYFVKRQLLALICGLVALAFMAITPYTLWAR